MGLHAAAYRLPSRSLEESERVRSRLPAKYLQNYVIDFYPMRLDIVEQMRQTAKELGGQLEVPRLSWKYSWIKALFGWNLAQRARIASAEHQVAADSAVGQSTLFGIQNRRPLRQFREY